eukprot:TRINITY_DN82125_c0_g1_i1.p1 TRINITY_DN82125_c0_g1~~TRINITY_DN82125_c0_g1_i1.p1  ORF type:complete len:116 (-),score=16.72 TRINITY_DN82125_c0_g1_i1:207-554(-)
MLSRGTRSASVLRLAAFLGCLYYAAALNENVVAGAVAAGLPTIIVLAVTSKNHWLLSVMGSIFIVIVIFALCAIAFHRRHDYSEPTQKEKVKKPFHVQVMERRKKNTRWDTTKQD